MFLPSDWRPHAPLEPLHLDWLRRAGVEVAVLRLDLMDPLINGNKWFKLVEHLKLASESHAQGIISLGGPWSNHLHALAAAGKRFGFATVGLLRGHPQETATVADLQALGMQLHWLGYGGYRARHAADFWIPWLTQYPGFRAVPEGGGGILGARGCGQLLTLVEQQLHSLGWHDHDGWWLACGTGTTAAGLILAEGGRRPLYGVLAVPADHGVAQQITAILHEGALPDSGYELLDGSRGGFAKVDPQLLAFIAETELASGVALEPLYTGKALLALKQQVEGGRFAAGTRLIFVHTGGLQGRRGFVG
ncbi:MULTISPECIES: 1-aminocyclopropane-1-carboxylate deaminase/D-cysteine desulfhydrase [Pseudomonas]|uniref:1-aminocyclopropane-1-carboxylate deaminase/D-cysteine desulfhydrase n=1 Tax=Pseudomonas TaxID=286 RepID=UPI000CFE60D6|nr:MULTISPECIES: pyridoxal-phosphate dependent enzyme [Pseudomonas]PRA48342.1 1-aminocyclopropane-1-carboxylate deaminase [Pseudomonas sp. MYb115]QXN51995.1 pyridoxal-phosphate dependent enzyme [Pseudomonas fluorescens]WSO26323.1 pyridoxal-phosphate dependent enzyme [Pseudomonas fluorescens]